MALWLPPSQFGKTETNVTAAARFGTLITASGTAHVKGAYSAGQLIATTSEDTYGITVTLSDIHQSATVTSCLVDIGIGPSGSEVDLIQDLNGWGAPAPGQGGTKTWYFPVFIPKGERVAARSQALIVSDTIRVAIWLHQAADDYGMNVPVMWERLGAVTNSNGVAVTPASGAFGSWTTILDPTTKPYSWWHVGFDAQADTTQAVNTSVLIELGFGETTAAVTTIGSWTFTKTTAETETGPFPSVPVYAPYPSDTIAGIFARMAAGGVEVRGVLVYAAE